MDLLRYFHPVLTSSELAKKPVRVELAGSVYALFRDGTGKACAVADRCPHRYAPLSAGWVRPDGRLACPYHGWHFDGAGCGQSPSVLNFNCQTTALQVVEKDQSIWIAAQGVSPDSIPGPDHPHFTLAGSFAEIFPTPLHVALDNFCEDEHTPFIHHRLGWTEAEAPLVKFDASNHPDHTEVHYQAPQRRNLFFVKRGDLFFNDFQTYFDPPRIHYHLFWKDPTGATARDFEIFVLIYFVPITANSTRVHAILYVKRLGGFRIFRPLVHRIACWIVREEIRDDCRFISAVANTPFDMRGMKLSKFDKPLLHNHKLLKQIYLGEPAAGVGAESGVLAAETPPISNQFTDGTRAPDATNLAPDCE